MHADVLDKPIDPDLTRRRASIEEFWALPESNLHIEYINGEIVMAPSPNVIHQVLVLSIVRLLDDFVRREARGKVFISPLDVELSSGDVVQPDIFFLPNEAAAQARDIKRVKSTPPFLIEILSPGSVGHDTLTKRDLYEKNGVREYWIVDANARSIAQLVLRKKHFVLAELSENDTIRGAVLAGFEMNVGELFAEP